MDKLSNSAVFDNILDMIPVGVFWKDKNRRFLGANKMFLDYYGLESVDDLIGRTDEDMGWHIDPEPFRAIELQVIHRGSTIADVPGQCIVKGQVRKIKASKCPLIIDGVICGLVGYFVDVTEELAEKDRLSILSQTDELTGVYNRRAFTDIAQQYIDQYDKDGTDFVLYMIDLDDFKAVNDENGHEFGNLVLQSICKSLIHTAAGNSVLFRYGGDEFVILHQYKDASLLEEKQKRIMSAIDAPRNIEGCKVTVRASVGYALYSEHLYLSSLLEEADRQMYDMKREHKTTN